MTDAPDADLNRIDIVFSEGIEPDEIRERPHLEPIIQSMQAWGSAFKARRLAEEAGSELSQDPADASAAQG